MDNRQYNAFKEPLKKSYIAYSSDKITKTKDQKTKRSKDQRINRQKDHHTNRPKHENFHLNKRTKEQ